MNHKEFVKWEKTRAKGRFRYVFLTGIIRFCIPYCIIKIVISKFQHPSNNPFAQFDIISLIVYSIGGCFLALMIWKHYEKKYLLKKDEIAIG